MMSFALQIPCVTQHFFPETMENLVKLCQHAKYTISIPDKQTCCGLPYFEKGELKTAKAIGEYNLEVFGNTSLVCGSPKCQDTFSQKYPKIFNNTVSHNESVGLAKNTSGLSALFKKLSPANTGNIRGKYFVVEHCQSPELVTPKQLSAFADAEWVYPKLEHGCCGAGTCMPTSNRQFSYRMGLELLQQASNAGADYIVTMDDICRQHLINVAAENNLPVKTLHIIDIFAMAL